MSLLTFKSAESTPPFSSGQVLISIEEHDFPTKVLYVVVSSLHSKASPAVRPFSWQEASSNRKPATGQHLAALSKIAGPPRPSLQLAKSRESQKPVITEPTGHSITSPSLNVCQMQFMVVSRGWVVTI